MAHASVRAALTRRLAALASRLRWARSPRFGRSIDVEARDDLVGLEGSGGRWHIPAALLEGGSVCYSCGLGTDLGLELGLAVAFGCAVFAFDPTPRASALAAEAVGLEDCLRFFPLGLRSRDGTNEPTSSQSLASLMRQLGHREIDLLKVDVGGAEREVLRGAVDDGVDIGVICVKSDSRAGLRETANLLQRAGFHAVAVTGVAATFVSEAVTGLPF